MRLTNILFLSVLNIFIASVIIFSDNNLVSNKQNITNLSNLPNIVFENTDDRKDEIADTISVIFGGDVMLGRMVMQTSLNNKDSSYPFNEIADITKSSDIFFVNLENPIMEKCPLTSEGFKFCSRPEMLQGLIKAGINIVNLANNHSGNYGLNGIAETRKYMDSEGIVYTGINNLAIKSFSNFSIGFLGFDFTVNSPSEADYQLIKDSDKKVDFLIVGVHWGEEYKNTANKSQRKWAGEMVKNGADIIIGHHPHWVQDYECIPFSHSGLPTEVLMKVEAQRSEAIESASSVLPPSIVTPAKAGIYLNRSLCDGISGKPVYYSLGNLVFDQMWSEETRKGMLVKMEIGKNGITKEERFNTYIRDIGQPEIITNF
jgi:poly-gamma-glutamate capsule biosynthesis protein CapA/YwtB (metallophosphatase superfamily)